MFACLSRSWQRGRSAWEWKLIVTAKRYPGGTQTLPDIAPGTVWVTLALCAQGWIRKDASSESNIPGGVHERGEKQSGRRERQT